MKAISAGKKKGICLEPEKPLIYPEGKHRNTLEAL